MLAAMFVVPSAIALANPVCATEAAAPFEEAQPANADTSCVDLSAYLPMAMNCWVSPTATAAVPGVTVIEVNGAGLTVKDVEPVKAGVVSFAVMVALPTARPVASPRPAPLVPMEAVAGAEEVQVAVLVTSFVTPLLKASSA